MGACVAGGSVFGLSVCFVLGLFEHQGPAQGLQIHVTGRPDENSSAPVVNELNGRMKHASFDTRLNIAFNFDSHFAKGGL